MNKTKISDVAIDDCRINAPRGSCDDCKATEVECLQNLLEIALLQEAGDE